MKKHSGFTLVELMITLAIVGILLLVGVPSLKTFMKGNQLIASSNELLSALHVARSEAIKLNNSVTICESSNGTTCTDPVTGNWEGGWIVFVSAAAPLLTSSGAACDADNVGTNCLLRVHDAIPDGKFSVLAKDADAAVVGLYTFNSRGLPRSAAGSAGSAQSGVFSVCSMDDAGTTTLSSRAVVVSLSGRVRVSDNTAVNSCP